MHRYIQGTLATPLAGVELSELPNYADAFRLLTLRAKLVTSATVSNRWPHIQFVSPSGNVIHEVAPHAAQAASTAVYYDLCGSGGASLDGSAVNDDVSSMSLPDFWWPAGTKVVSVTTNLQAADQWEDVYWSALVGEEFEHLKWLSEIASSLG